MKYFIYIFAIIILLGLNLGLFGSMPIFGQVPNFLFLFTLCFATEKKDYDFLFVAFVSGLFLDAFSAHFFGAYTFAFLILSSGLHLLVHNFIVLDPDWKFFIALLLGSWAGLRLLLWLYGLAVFKMHLAPETLDLSVYFNGFIWSFVYNLLLLYPAFLFYNTLRRIIDDLVLRKRGIVR